MTVKTRIPKDMKKVITHLVRVPIKYDQELRRQLHIHKYRSLSEFYYMVGQETLKRLIRKSHEQARNTRVAR